MKKFNNPRPIPNGGMPIFGGDFTECLQTEVYRAITAQYKSLNEPIIIYGCAVTANLDAETCTITAGMAFLNGDLIDVPAYAGSYPVYLQEGAVTEISKNFKDQTPRVVMLQKTSHWLNEAGDDDNILFNPYTSQYLKDVQRRVLTPLGRCEWFPDYPNADAFDVTGLGKWEWLGYAVANSSNDTAPMTGRIPAQFDPATDGFHIGQLIGGGTSIISTDNLPDISIVIKGQAGNKPAFGGGLPGYWPSDGGPDETGHATFEGGHEPLSIVQKTISGVVLQRIEYTL